MTDTNDRMRNIGYHPMRDLYTPYRSSYPFGYFPNGQPVIQARPVVDRPSRIPKVPRKSAGPSPIGE